MEYIVGVVVAIFVQVSKKYLGTNKWGTILLVLLVSLLASTIYYFMGKFPHFLETLIKILSVAGAIHNYIIRQFEDKQTDIIPNFTRTK